jgi:streptogramin lyase
MSANRHLWVADRGTSKLVEYDLNGHYLYSWGMWGDFPGGMWGVHGMSVDQEGNVYLAEVDNGRTEKFAPKKGANPLFLVGAPVRPVWK